MSGPSLKFRVLILLGLLAATASAGTVEEEAARAVDLFYDLQFDAAFRAAQELDGKYPDSPAGLFYLSVAYYQRYLLEDPPSENTISQFWKTSDQALAKAVKLEKQAPALSHYYQGGILGFQARELVAQKRYARAIPKARQAANHLTKALELDPSLVDAKLGLGLYYYFLDRLPSAAKPIARLMIGMWGDRAKGLAYLREAAQKGGAGRREVESILAAIAASQWEQNWTEAQTLLTGLVKAYPHNPRFRLSLVYVYQRQGRWLLAAETADPEGSWIAGLDPFVKARAEELARYRAAENWLFADRWQEAVIQLDRIESGAVTNGLQDWVALRRGNALDAQGRPADAGSYYSLIRDQKAKALAEQFQITPFPAGPRDVMPNRWPLSNIPGQ